MRAYMNAKWLKGKPFSKKQNAKKPRESLTQAAWIKNLIFKTNNEDSNEVEGGAVEDTGCTLGVLGIERRLQVDQQAPLS